MEVCNIMIICTCQEKLSLEVRRIIKEKKEYLMLKIPYVVSTFFLPLPKNKCMHQCIIQLIFGFRFHFLMNWQCMSMAQNSRITG